METHCISCKKYTAKEKSMLEKLNKIDQCSCQIALFVESKNRPLQK